MTSLKSVSIIICVCSIICSIFGLLAPFGTMKKISNMILGVFLISSMAVPVKGLFDSFNMISDITEQPYSVDEQDNSIDDAVLKQTCDNLVNAADNLLIAENIHADNIQVTLKKADNNSIYISSINIYISKEYLNSIDQIKSIIKSNMSKEPVVIQSG